MNERVPSENFLSSLLDLLGSPVAWGLAIAGLWLTFWNYRKRLEREAEHDLSAIRKSKNLLDLELNKAADTIRGHTMPLEGDSLLEGQKALRSIRQELSNCISLVSVLCRALERCGRTHRKNVCRGDIAPLMDEIVHLVPKLKKKYDLYDQDFGWWRKSDLSYILRFVKKYVSESASNRIELELCIVAD